MEITQKYINDLAYKIVGRAIEVHKILGPGLIESVYEHCFLSELKSAGLEVKSQIPVNIKYKDDIINFALRLDVLVNDIIVVELKAVETILPLHKAQLLSYLKLAMKPKGLLINFNCENITNQLVPLVTEEFSNLPLE
ncbi:MAG: GxxExxY protein [Ignavibacteria bacterium]|nr:GxxExxY protein [Ignavibacteria bacterium]